VGKINKWNHYSVLFLKKEHRCFSRVRLGKREKECRVKICVSGSLSRSNDGHCLPDSSASRRDVISGPDGLDCVINRRWLCTVASVVSPRQFHHRHMSNELFISWNRFIFFQASDKKYIHENWCVIHHRSFTQQIPKRSRCLAHAFKASHFFLLLLTLGCLPTTRVCCPSLAVCMCCFPAGR
jgi:hypothetical protein